MNYETVLTVFKTPCGLLPAESDGFSDSQTQRGMDRYLDSLFDPVLSDSSTNMERASLSARMKGGGGVGISGGGRGGGQGHTSPTRPYPPGIHPGGKTLSLESCLLSQKSIDVLSGLPDFFPTSYWLCSDSTFPGIH
ncbi:unconventional myosin-XV-like [Nothobranchius furzeri]|uniref:Unconventional myosin-XV-like n=1 Tax=Nothobranchius furzeri TaxID=105023 RepID=A0A9D2YHX3_NOTFU|nr:unconventional myosin-XV-like [Nothobranchius furzeri]